MEQYRVLLADDEAEIRQGISRKIDWAAQGFVLAGEAENGAEALELAEQIRPDVVLTDIKMPFMDGLELCRRLRRELFFARLLAENNIQKESLSETEKTLLRVIEKLEVQQESDVLKLKREVEHTLVAVDDSLNNMIKKLQQSSDISESRILDIEQTLKRDVQSSINTKLEKRVKAIEDVFDAHLKEAVKKSNKAWMIPFVLLVVVIAFVLLFVYVGMGRECEV